MAYISDDDLKRLQADCARVTELEKQVAELKAEVEYGRNYLEYERNKYERLLEMEEHGIVADLNQKLKLELDALRDIASYVPDDDQKRILRRLGRIDEILES